MTTHQAGTGLVQGTVIVVTCSRFAVLARREGKVERHIRLLLPLAFLSPRIVSKILDGTAPAGLTITVLARALPWSWAEQERRLGLPCDQRARPQQQYSASLSNGGCMR